MFGIMSFLFPILFLAVFGIVMGSIISTLFKNTVGINFHDYLTRIRLEHALTDLATTDKTLTEIAVTNGFSDLKTFNREVKATLNRTPAEYRSQLGPGSVRQRFDDRKYFSIHDPVVQKKLAEYMSFPKGMC